MVDHEETNRPQGDGGHSASRAATARPARVARPPRPPRQTLDGVLLIDKPVGLSSHDALLRAKGILRAKKAGHTGTLDPLASGLLPLCFGEATKFSQDLLDADKYYDATMRLGERTDTGDAEGEIIETRPVDCDMAAIDAAIAAFRGEIEQVPPMYSAIKRDGKPLYEYARAGQVVERESRRIVIHALERLSDVQVLRDAQSVHIRVHCSKGTYIRTLAEDIGEHLGCGAHLTALRRTRVGVLTIDGAYTLAALQERLNGMTSVETDRSSPVDTTGAALALVPALDPAGLLQPIDSLLSSFPAVTLGADYTRRFLHGQRLRLTEQMMAPACEGPTEGQADAKTVAATTSPAVAATSTIAGSTIEQISMQWPEGQSAQDLAVADIGRVRVYAPDERLLGTATLNGGLLAPERLVGTTASI